MARIARIKATGFPHHIVQRGNNKNQVFLDVEDRRHYLHLLIKYTKKWLTPTLAYCLMNNHIHLLITPSYDNSMHKMMQGISLCYTQYINRKYNRTGRLWECRYYSSIVDTENYLWSVLRYIEQNPVRANYVSHAEDYPFSSARCHILGTRDSVINDNIIREPERKAYSDYLRSGTPEDELHNIKSHTKSGKPFGSDSFIKKLEDSLQRKLRLNKVGRPEK